MTITELLQRLSQIKIEIAWDKETAHKLADQALLDYINDAGVSAAWNDLVATAATEPTPGQIESWEKHQTNTLKEWLKENWPKVT